MREVVVLPKHRREAGTILDSHHLGGREGGAECHGQKTDRRGDGEQSRAARISSLDGDSTDVADQVAPLLLRFPRARTEGLRCEAASMTSFRKVR